MSDSLNRFLFREARFFHQADYFDHAPYALQNTDEPLVKVTIIWRIDYAILNIPVKRNGPFADFIVDLELAPFYFTR
ncbi:MAG: hypothetical protein ACREJM_15205 [Candidatus Saccharimonadales bacterium]